MSVVQYTVSDDTVYDQQTITDAHFGVNLVTIYDEEFVDPDNELSENVAQLGASTLRFPGGSATENFFDMTAPNAAVSTRDPSETLTPMDAFFAQAGETGVDVALVIPTQMAFAKSAAEAMLDGTYGTRSTLSETYLTDVAGFVATAVAYAEANGVHITAFEIGNEFWGSGEMGPAEYGLLAGQVAALLDAQLSSTSASEAEIVVQSTSAASRLYASRNDVDAYVGHEDGVLQVLTQGDIDANYGGVVPEGWQAVRVPGQGGARQQVSKIANGINATSGAADAVDGLVQHYYQSGGFDTADGTKSFKFSQFRTLEDRLNRAEDSPDLSYHITEWNTNSTGAENNRGLQNAAMIVENFFELVANGIDVAQIWPLSFDAAQGISLVDVDGPDLAISGEMFRLMSESLSGLSPAFDWSVPGEIDVHGFQSDSRSVYFVSERSGVNTDGIVLDLSEFMTGGNYFWTSTQLWDGGAGGADASAEPVLSDMDGGMMTGTTVSFDLDSWANRRIEVTRVGDGDDTVQGRSGNDTLQGHGGDDMLRGGAGDDTFLEDAGHDMIDGESGYDTVVFSGAMATYSAMFDADFAQGDPLRIAGASGEIDTLFGIEVLMFSDGSLSLEDVADYFDFLDDSDPASGVLGVPVSVADIAAPPEEPNIQLEIGRTSIKQIAVDYWQTVTFSESIEDAAVIMGPASHHGNQPFTIRVRNVTEDGFEFQLDEWDYQDGLHLEIDISWMAGSVGEHALADGSKIVFGSTSTNALEKTIVSLAGFEDKPIVFGQLSGDSEASAITHRINDVSTDGFEFEVQVEEASTFSRSSIEATTFSWVAMDVAEDSFLFETGETAMNHRYGASGAHLDAGDSLFAGMQTTNENDPAILRYKMLEDGDIRMKIHEEKSADHEGRHSKEDVAWIVIDEGVYEFV